ncbi:MAG: thiamine biosynthesis lipoprotein [Saprospiraceae bacterium]|jgi:thiamine biosynthesis lipoprotein
MKILIRFFCFTIVLSGIFSCQLGDGKGEVPASKITGYTQGTTYTIKYIDTLNRDIQPQVDSILNAIDLAVSTYISNSILSRFNACDSCIVINNHVLDLFLMSDEIYQTTDGAFDPSVKPLVNLWGFGDNPLQTDTLFLDAATTMDREKMLLALKDSLVSIQLENVGLDLVVLDGDILSNDIGEIGTGDDDSEDEDDFVWSTGDVKDNYLCKKETDLKMSFDAIAQGYSADVIGDFLQFKLGINDFLIEIGGEVLTQGKKSNGEHWVVQIENPDLNNPNASAGIVSVPMSKFRAVAVSGNYRSYHELLGEKYGHCIDPRTGYPSKSKIVSVATFANECGVADAYATALMVMGIDEAVPFIEGHPFEGVEAFFIYYNEDGNLETYVSSGLEELIKKK